MFAPAHNVNMWYDNLNSFMCAIHMVICVHAEVSTLHYTCVSHAGELTDIVKQWKDAPVFVVGKATAAAGVINCVCVCVGVHTTHL